MNRIIENFIWTTSNDDSEVYRSHSPSLNPDTNSSSKCELVTGSSSLSDYDVIPWFASVDDYSFIDNYKGSDLRGCKSIKNEYSDDFSKLFAEVSLLKSKYMVQ